MGHWQPHGCWSWTVCSRVCPRRNRWREPKGRSCFSNEHVQAYILHCRLTGKLQDWESVVKSTVSHCQCLVCMETQGWHLQICSPWKLTYSDSLTLVPCGQNIHRTRTFCRYTTSHCRVDLARNSQQRLSVKAMTSKLNNKEEQRKRACSLELADLSHLWIYCWEARLSLQWQLTLEGWSAATNHPSEGSLPKHT